MTLTPRGDHVYSVAARLLLGASVLALERPSINRHWSRFAAHKHSRLQAPSNLLACCEREAEPHGRAVRNWVFI